MNLYGGTDNFRTLILYGKLVCGFVLIFYDGLCVVSQPPCSTDTLCGTNTLCGTDTLCSTDTQCGTKYSSTQCSTEYSPTLCGTEYSPTQCSTEYSPTQCGTEYFPTQCGTNHLLTLTCAGGVTNIRPVAVLHWSCALLQ